MERIRNLSIRKSIVLYMGIAIIIGFLLSIFCMWSVGKVQQNIWRKYAVSENFTEQTPDIKTEEPSYQFSRKVERIAAADMSVEDAVLSEVCDFIDTWCILIITMAGCVISGCLFYRNKIKKPLELLEEGSRQISNQQLDFHIEYRNRDELGRLCGEFEKMRAELESNNKKMWRMMERERTVREAIAHDIRSPLAIIKGYQETLKVFVPSGKLDEKKLLEIADACLKQVDRLDTFVETMKRLSKVEEREISRQVVPLENIVRQIKENTHFLNSSQKIGCTVSVEGSGTLQVDTDILYEVYENLLANALRYAKEEINVLIEKKSDTLEICVCDDGNGFEEDVKDAVKAYHHGPAVGEEIHFGLGLYICDVYCRKHGGYLKLENRQQGGASVKAVFEVS